MKEITSLNQTSNKIHLKNTAIVVSFHALAIVALFYFSWQNLVVLLILNWMVASLGIGIGFHRLLTHRGFKTPKWLEYGLTILGSLAIQDGAIKWVATHRIHHAHTETEKDPHSPREAGGIWAHVGWIMRGTAQEHDAATLSRYVPDLLKDRFHVALARYYSVPTIILGLILFAAGGWTMVLWGIFLRTVVGWHETWLVNSATHLWGTRRFETNDDSTNNPVVGFLAFGEGWHNNHHAHPVSARHGLKWYEFDMNWLTIKLFEKLGLAKQVKVYKI
ncbi:MAG TPA: fatty acid desaturase [Pyrinomonadaceae bacterium]|jgi:stearoyl-CoA desaturase (delta-9 desaturase)